MAIIRTVERPTLVQRARQLRNEDTRAEAKLWNALRDRRLGGWKWRRQVPRGPFIVDFCCAEARLVVEVDGGQHADAVDYDARRTAWLEMRDLRVLRFWNSDVLANCSGVCLTILGACGGDRLSPPRGERAG